MLRLGVGIIVCGKAYVRSDNRANKTVERQRNLTQRGRLGGEDQERESKTG